MEDVKWFNNSLNCPWYIKYYRCRGTGSGCEFGLCPFYFWDNITEGE